jgi:hypothetical protein
MPGMPVRTAIAEKLKGGIASTTALHPATMLLFIKCI